MIKKVSSQDDFNILAKLLNEAFATVAEDFGLTKENSPTNNAFITGEELELQLTGNREFYVYENYGEKVGFIAVEKSLSTLGTFYIEKMAVTPACRHYGIGLLLMDFATNRIKELGGKRISIGLIDSNTILKEWYSKQGFAEFEHKTFDHLPFNVCMMEKNII
ncbi:MAG: GNAT family N-acetyltransferase [Tannerella sp.]|jgi:ribosomal protein S18 acetylase RimI-like enzyme|nr:GNAT family N-acetyltransferase [Tannerella sp.]